MGIVYCTMPYHFGKSIEKAVRERGITVAEFARRIEKSRENAYDIFKRKDLDTELIRTISKVLGHDFLAESLGKQNKMRSDETANTTVQDALQKLEQQITALQSRTAFLEKCVKAFKPKGKK